jgi:hypothetical protein
MTALRTINLILAFIATTAPLAHVLELPSKLTLDGPLWLAVQQHLYRGWGAIFGPVEIAALALTGVLLAVTWPTGARRISFLAFACYAAMIAVFFLFNAPVNEALNGWTAATLPTNWSTYRLRWEIGHAFAAALAVIAFVALMRQPRSCGSSGQFGISCRLINSTTPISASGRKPTLKRSPGPRPACVGGPERDKSTSILPET